MGGEYLDNYNLTKLKTKKTIFAFIEACIYKTEKQTYFFIKRLLIYSPNLKENRMHVELQTIIMPSCFQVKYVVRIFNTTKISTH